MKKKEIDKELKSKNKIIVTVFLIALGLVAIVFATQFLIPSSNNNTVQIPNTDSDELVGLNAFANCLSENNVVFYGTRTCPACAQQRNLFGDSLRYVNYVECDANSQNQNICARENIRSVPTWKINGEVLVGVQSLQVLASRSGCEL